MTDQIRLTQMTKGSGCGCKVAPAILADILSRVSPSLPNIHLVAGYETSDDAAIYALDSENYLISTVDFFTPVVDDPYIYGKIAAANSISDVYAMGGEPLFATAVLGFPAEKLSAETISRIIEGAKSVCEEASIPLAGGHTIDNPEPFFGLSVTGKVKAAHLKKNIGAQVGDAIYITKELGSGIMNTAIKRGIAEEGHVALYLSQVTQLNSIGSLFGSLHYVNAMTDVTGFGLLGHLLEMTKTDEVSAEIYISRIPSYSFIDDYLKLNCIPDNTYRNWNAYEKRVTGLTDMKAFQLLNDPQTNGGLMVAIDKDHVQEFEQLMKMNAKLATRIGTFIPKEALDVVIKS